MSAGADLLPTIVRNSSSNSSKSKSMAGFFKVDLFQLLCNILQSIIKMYAEWIRELKKLIGLVG